MAVYLSHAQMSDTNAGKRGRFPHSFICSLRDAHFLFGSPDSLFRSLGDVLEERACRPFGLWLVCRRRASVRDVVINGSHFIVRGFDRVNLHCIWDRAASLIDVHIVHVRCVGWGSRCMGSVGLSISCRKTLSQLNVSPNVCQESCMENWTWPKVSETQIRENHPDAYSRSENPIRASA